VKNCSELKPSPGMPCSSRSPWLQGLLKVNDQSGVSETLLFSSAVKCSCWHRVAVEGSGMG